MRAYFACANVTHTKKEKSPGIDNSCAAPGVITDIIAVNSNWTEWSTIQVVIIRTEIF